MRARLWLTATCVAAVIAGCATSLVTRPSSPDDLRAHACYLASDDLDGRFPGTAGIDQAAAYIEAELKEAGLKPLFGQSYRQEFTIDLGIEIEGQPVFKVADASLDYSILPISGSGTIWAGVVLAKDPAAAGPSDVTGKVVLVIEDPKVERERWTMVGRDGLLEWMRENAARAADLGAGAVVFVSGAAGAPVADGAGPGTLEPASAEGFHVFAVPMRYVPARIPCLEVTYSGLQKAMASQGILLEDFHRRLERDPALPTIAIAGVRCEMGLTTRPKQVKVANVGGLVPGRRHRHQCVVVGAHYDHLGRGELASATPWRREVYNGADDNASGVSALLETARQIRERGTPARSVAFVCFTAEELGALGSAHYCEHPPFAISQTEAMINLDTVGRLEADNLIVFGARSAEEMSAALRSANRRAGLSIAEKKEIYGFSDQNPFYQRGVPAVHLFTGANTDYHTPDDDCGNLNYQGLARIADFASDLAWDLAGATCTLTPVVAAEEPSTAPPGRGRGGYLGVVPDFSFAGDGVKIKGCSPGSPAEAAGLEAGDVILRVDGAPLADLKGLMSALGQKNPGDEIVLEVRRGEATLTKTARIGVRAAD
jgi:hypothetical protein